MASLDSKSNLSLSLPPELPPLLLGWYDKNARTLPWRRDRDPYRVWVSEIMLQQTGAAVVSRYYTRFLDALPDIAALAAAPEPKLLKLWEGLGYYARARNMQKAARMILEEYGGEFPDTYEALRRLPGVGAYTAGAVASICFELPTPAVDGNAARIVSRIAGLRTAVTDTVKKQMEAALKEIYPPNRRGDFTQSLMELGAVLCLPNGAPKCIACPVSGFCAARRAGDAAAIPVRTKKQPKKLRKLTVFLLSRGDETALLRRDKAGLLGGLWELPNVPGHLDEKEALAAAASWGAGPAELKSAARRSHVFTHIRWDMLCYAIECRRTSRAAQEALPLKLPALTWAGREALRDTVPLPTAFRKCLDAGTLSGAP